VLPDPKLSVKENWPWPVDNAFNHRDLRVEEDVSDLELVSYFGGVPHHLTIFSPVLSMMWKIDKNSVWDRSVRLRAGGDLE
jgi:hypothetical protein